MSRPVLTEACQRTSDRQVRRAVQLHEGYIRPAPEQDAQIWASAAEYRFFSIGQCGSDGVREVSEGGVTISRTRFTSPARKCARERKPVVLELKKPDRATKRFARNFQRLG